MRQEEDKVFMVNAIDEKPVRLDMAFTESNEITGQIVIAVLFRKGFHPR